ncbi:hypothetical protein C5167_041830 [Papaver somniferum]|nr:hypothetical protein C5167_041830 [Papaver somniferum]
MQKTKFKISSAIGRFVYTGSVDVTLDMAQDLLGAADQYLLAGLKRLCEYAIAQDVTLEMSQPCTSYRRTSMHAHLIQCIIPEIRDYFTKALAYSDSTEFLKRQF